MTSDSDKRW